MEDRKYLIAVPAFYANGNGVSVPFIVSVLLVDEHQHPRFTPAVERSIDTTIKITAREGLVTGIIGDADDVSEIARKYLMRASRIEGSILLFLCQSGETAEKVMQSLSTEYTLSLVQRTPITCTSGE